MSRRLPLALASFRSFAAILVSSALGAAALAQGCSPYTPPNPSHFIDTTSATTGGGTASSAGQGGAGGDEIIMTESGGGSGVGGSDACATSSAEASLIPVNMFIMFDRSGSMKDNNKWGNATSALTAFFEDPGTAGLRVALRFFPEGDCSNTACDVNACSQPAVPLAELTGDPAPMDAQEKALVSTVEGKNTASGGGTPLSAALGGAEKWALAYQAAHPVEKTVVVLVTDGAPNGCDENINHIAKLASDAFVASGVLTYAVGLVGSNQSDMDKIAQAGQTTQGFFIGNGNAQADLLAALQSIQGSQVACEFAMPDKTADGEMIDPALVNVEYLPGGGGAKVEFGQVADAGACTAQKGGWYYDDPQKPTSITLCPTTCSAIQSDPDAKVQILFGCATKPAN
ncbi:MAG: vWA domain-containing protein [Byssovorax sp.]